MAGKSKSPWPRDCLVVKDAPAVIKSVKAAGFPTLAVVGSYPADKLAAADWVVPSLRPQDVRKKLGKLAMEVG